MLLSFRAFGYGSYKIFDNGALPFEQRPDLGLDARPRYRSRTGDFEVPGTGNNDKPNRIAGTPGCLHICLHELVGDEVLMSTTNEHLGDTEWK